MRRLLITLMIVGAVVATVWAGVIVGRARPAWWSTAKGMVTNRHPMPEMPSGAAPPTLGSESTTRGDVVIDSRRQQLIGVRTVRASMESMDDKVRAVGVIRADETRLTDVNVKIDGWIRELYVDYTGQPIQKDQQLFTLYSPDVLTTESELVLALKARDELQQSPIADARERNAAMIAAARQRLVLWDLPAEEIRAVEEKRQATGVVAFRSPAAGFVIEKQAIKGLHVTAGQSLYKVADLSSVWLEASLHENQLASIHAGDVATITIDAYPGARFGGRVMYVYPSLNEMTRTNQVRFQLSNPGGRLRPGMYGNAEMKTRGSMGLMLPADAVLDSGTEQVVFVAQGNGMFEPRKVKIGRRLGDVIEILDGIKEDEEIATGATFFLDSDSQLRGSLRSYQAPGTGTPSGPQGPETNLDIVFRGLSDPVKTGDNQFEAIVKDAGGKPVDDAEVTLQLSMPAMPTMNMPAMRSDARLSHLDGGVYRGTGQVMMAGRWDATITVARGGQRLGVRQVPVVAR